MPPNNGSPTTLSSWAKLAHALADAAARQSLPLFQRGGIAAINKDAKNFNPVTRADTAAERAMRHILARQCPTHAIWGEEEGFAATDSQYLWVLDPIDGTRSFITGNPLWGCLIALLQKHKTGYRLLISLIDMPSLQERYIAIGKQRTRAQHVLGHARKWKTLKTRAMARLTQAHILSTSPDMFASPRPLARRWQAINQKTELIRYGGDCYNYALLAAGRVDAVIDKGNKTHDTQALIGIVEQAGGIITDWQGQSLLGPHRTEQARGETLACGDRRLHKQLLTMLQY